MTEVVADSFSDFASKRPDLALASDIELTEAQSKQVADLLDIEEIFTLVETTQDVGTLDLAEFEMTVDILDLEPEQVASLYQYLSTTGVVFENQFQAPTNRQDKIVEEAGSIDALKLYFAQISEHKLLTAHQEVQLAKRIEKGVAAQNRLDLIEGYIQGVELSKKETKQIESTSQAHIDQLKTVAQDGRAAKAKLINSNLRLVTSIAKNYRSFAEYHGLSFMDIIQDGSVGLNRAAEKFDWRKGFKFSTYASWWIRQAVQRGIADKGRTIRIPVHVSEQLQRLYRTRRRMGQELGREPRAEELADDLKLSLEKTQDLIKLGDQTHLPSLEKPVGEDGDSSLGDFIEDSQNKEFDETLFDKERKRLVAQALATLSERQRQVLQLRYGLDGAEPATLEEIGKQFGTTRERVRQIEADGLKKLGGLGYLGSLANQES